MNDLIKSLEAYNIFNYLVPGTITCAVVSWLFEFRIEGQNLIMTFFIYYFAGLLVSRLGSLLVGPFLRKLRVLNYIEYKKFVKAQKKDEKIDLLSRENNMYRTYVAMSLIFLCLIVVSKVYGSNEILDQNFALIMVAATALLAIMVGSYRKQTSFVVKRVEHNS